MRAFVEISFIAGLMFAGSAGALAQGPDDEAGVRAVIADWYKRVGQAKADAPWALMAPGAIDGGPGYSVPADLHSGAAVIRGPYLNRELAGRALVFAYDIDALTVDEHLASARVWERGYSYAAATQKTYENAATALFVLEKQADGQWKILAHEARSVGIPPNRITDPMPDLKAAYYARCGEACNPDAETPKAAQP